MAVMAVVAVVAVVAAVAAVAFLRNPRKQECNCAFSLCNCHVHHIRNVQRCSFSSLFIRHLSRMQRQRVI